MSPWPTIELRHLLELDLIKVPVEPLQTYKMVGIYSFGGGLFFKESVTGSTTSYKYFYKLKTDHIVLSQLFGWEGAIALSSSEFEDAYVSPQFPTFLCYTNQIDRQYLGWLMRRKSFWEELGRSAKGLGVRRRTLNPESLLSIEISLPPLDEQRRIAARLDAIAAQVEQAKRLQINILENITKLIVSLHVNMAKNREVTLSEILELYEDQGPINPAHEYPQVGIRGFGKGIFYRETLSGSDTTYKHFNHLYEDAILLSQVKGWEGAIAVCPPEFANMYASPEYRTFRCIEKAAVPAYLSALFSTPWFLNQLKDLTRGIGARRQRIKPELFLGLKILMPDYEDQERAVSIYSKLETIQSIIPENQDKVTNLIPAVLERAFNEGL